MSNELITVEKWSLKLLRMIAAVPMTLPVCIMASLMSHVLAVQRCAPELDGPVARAGQSCHHSSVRTAPPGQFQRTMMPISTAHVE